jgi:hypothetical protein
MTIFISVARFIAGVIVAYFVGLFLTQVWFRINNYRLKRKQIKRTNYVLKPLHDAFPE